LAGAAFAVAMQGPLPLAATNFAKNTNLLQVFGFTYIKLMLNIDIFLVSADKGNYYE